MRSGNSRSTAFRPSLPKPDKKIPTSKTIVIPPNRIRYLSEIFDTVRSYHLETAKQAEAVRNLTHARESFNLLGDVKVN